MHRVSRDRSFISSIYITFLALILSSCGAGDQGAGKADAVQAPGRTVAVTVAKSQSRDVRVELFSVGRLVSMNTPKLAAEINARVVEVRVTEGQSVTKGQVLMRLDTTTAGLARQEARAEIQRLDASIANEQRRVERYRGLKAKNMMPEERLDDAEATLAVDKASLEAARARLAIAEDRLVKAEMVSPVNGVVEKRHVSVGDFVSVGQPLVTLSDTVELMAELPFPETVGHHIRVGQSLYLESAIAPGKVVEATVDRIRPQVGSMNRSLIVIANITNPGDWRPEATIEGYLVVETHRDAVVVPASSVVKRPAGNVLYVSAGSTGQQVRQLVVTPGVTKDGWVEIPEGLEPGATVIVEGAHYLSDGARIAVQEKLE